MSYLVTQSTHDIGILVALGARRENILRLVVRQGMQLTVIGIFAGLIGAVALTRVIASLLFGVSATDARYFHGRACVVSCGSIRRNGDSCMAGHAGWILWWRCGRSRFEGFGLTQRGEPDEIGTV